SNPRVRQSPTGGGAAGRGSGASHRSAMSGSRSVRALQFLRSCSMFHTTTHSSRSAASAGDTGSSLGQGLQVGYAQPLVRVGGAILEADPLGGERLLLGPGVRGVGPSEPWARPPVGAQYPLGVGAV